MHLTGRVARSIVWLRRDLRVADNASLFHACNASQDVCLAFVVNPPLLAQDRMGSPLACVFFDALTHLRADLRERGSDLALLIGDFTPQLAGLARRIGAAAVFFNEDYEPDAAVRDEAVTKDLEREGIAVHRHSDQVYFAPREVELATGEPYRAFAPYKRRWIEQRAVAPRPPYPSSAATAGKLIAKDVLGETSPVPAADEFGFVANPRFPKASEHIANGLLQSFLSAGGPVERYRDDRNFPALPATSFLSPQLRAGTIGIRTCVEGAYARLNRVASPARANVEAWISELVWREFYQMILARFPRVIDSPFDVRAERIAWQPPGEALAAWRSGMTGYPIVDAAMRQLNETGWMHNRLRMIAASFLSKDLLLDWRLGERCFEQRLADADVAQNNGGWQWAASTGADAAPYFRIFNPCTQSKRFDPQGTFIRRMLPELSCVPDEFVHEPWLMPPLARAAAGITLGRDYPFPIVDHQQARVRAIAAFQAAR